MAKLQQETEARGSTGGKASASAAGGKAFTAGGKAPRLRGAAAAQASRAPVTRTMPEAKPLSQEASTPRRRQRPSRRNPARYRGKQIRSRKKQSLCWLRQPQQSQKRQSQKPQSQKRRAKSRESQKPQRQKPQRQRQRTADDLPAPQRRPAGSSATTPPASAKAGDGIAVEMSREGTNLKLSFPFGTPTAAAVFSRADILWVVFDTKSAIDLSALDGESSRTIRGSRVHPHGRRRHRAHPPRSPASVVASLPRERGGP